MFYRFTTRPAAGVFLNCETELHSRLALDPAGFRRRVRDGVVFPPGALVGRLREPSAAVVPAGAHLVLWPGHRQSALLLLRPARADEWMAAQAGFVGICRGGDFNADLLRAHGSPADLARAVPHPGHE